MAAAPPLRLSVAALATSRIWLGPASLNPYTLHPVEIAGQIASLDLLSGGRACLGLSRDARDPGDWVDDQLRDIEAKRRGMRPEERDAVA